LKVYERFLKACLKRRVTVKCRRYSIKGVLLAYDNLCIAMAVTDGGGSLEQLVVINKNEIESISIDDKVALKQVWKALSEVDSDDGRD
jgi:small nuclear ribonucleoprotein (snRNP)-like protein